MIHRRLKSVINNQSVQDNLTHGTPQYIVWGVHCAGVAFVRMCTFYFICFFFFHIEFR